MATDIAGLFPGRPGEPLSARSMPTFLVGFEEQQEQLDKFQRRCLHFSETHQENKPLCFNAKAFQKTHPSKISKGQSDDDVTLASPMLLGICDGVSQVNDMGVDASELPRELLHSCESLAAAQLVPGKQSFFPKGEYSGPIGLLKEAYSDTSSLGSTSVLLAVMDNTTQIHGKVHPMLGVVTLGDCELLMLRRSKGPNQPLKVVLHTEKQRIGGNHQTPLQLLRLDDDLDPNFHEDAALDAIERGSGLHCMSTREGDVIIMGSDGVFDNLFVEEIVEICNQKLPPRASAGRDFEPADSNTFLEIAQCLVQKAHSKSDISGRCPPQNTPVGFGGKADDTSVLVAEVVEWTAAKREDWEQGQWQRSSWGQMFGCGHDGYSAAEATSDSDFEEDETSRDANSCAIM